MNRSRITALQRTAMFGAIHEGIIELLLERADVVQVPAGDFYFREGDRGNSAYLLEEGEISVLKEWGNELQLLRHLEAGDCFGEMALLDFGKRSASVRADVDTSAIEISARDLRAVAKRDPEQFALIYMNLGRELSRRLRDADDRLFRARFQDSAFSEGYAFAASSL
jgi:CRP/FNR family cyclic AMP-dependent transcriptional regulator